ncbi:MAG TPA: M48 family metallopeptidase [Pyrinomonadaceae bacterium]|nr:M48 family metallopeptidase [Pyrinomonadaceae bacterium]
MKRITTGLALNAIVWVVLTTAVGASAQSVWVAPLARTARTPLAPKPHAGHNIFKGEAEIWLADAIGNLGSSSVSISDHLVSDYVSQVGRHVAKYSTAPAREYKFIVTHGYCPDAWSIGDGRIYITLGMLRLIEDEDQLAGVLAHEIAHDAFAHPGKTTTRQLFWMTGIRKVRNENEVTDSLEKLHAAYASQPIAKLGETMLGFSRFDELEADRAAFYNTYKAGYNPLALRAMLKLYATKVKEDQGKQEYWRDEFLMLLFGSHPPDTQRFLALSWEANFVKLPPPDSHFASAAFDAMKQRVRD